MRGRGAGDRGRIDDVDRGRGDAAERHAERAAADEAGAGDGDGGAAGSRTLVRREGSGGRGTAGGERHGGGGVGLGEGSSGRTAEGERLRREGGCAGREADDLVLLPALRHEAVDRRGDERSRESDGVGECQVSVRRRAADAEVVGWRAAGAEGRKADQAALRLERSAVGEALDRSRSGGDGLAESAGIVERLTGTAAVLIDDLIVGDAEETRGQIVDD